MIKENFKTTEIPKVKNGIALISENVFYFLSTNVHSHLITNLRDPVNRKIRNTFEQIQRYNLNLKNSSGSSCTFLSIHNKIREQIYQ